MRVWVINPFDDVPGEGTKQRYWTLAELLAARGHDVTWWSSSWSHRRKQRRQLPPDIEGSLRYSIRLLETPAYMRNIGLDRLRNHRAYAGRLRREGDREIANGRPPSLILFSWPPMDTWSVAAAWKSRVNCRIVMDLQDIWPDNFILLLPPGLGLRWVLGKVINYAFNKRHYFSRLDAATTQSETYARYLREHDGPTKVHVCYLGASITTDDSKKVAAVLPSRQQASGALRLLYLGAMGRVYDLETLVKAIGLLRQSGVSATLDLAGEGDQLPRLRELAQQHGLAKYIHFHGYVTGQALVDLLRESDLGVVPMWPDSLVTVPNKAGEYLGAGLPIINSLPGELKDLLKQWRCGVFYQTSNVQSLTNAIMSYVQDAERLAIERKNALSLFKEKFDRARTYPCMVEWLEQLT